MFCRHAARHRSNDSCAPLKKAAENRKQKAWHTPDIKSQVLPLLSVGIVHGRKLVPDIVREAGKAHGRLGIIAVFHPHIVHRKVESRARAEPALHQRRQVGAARRECCLAGGDAVRPYQGVRVADEHVAAVKLKWCL